VPHDRGECAVSRQLHVVYHADLEVGQPARSLPRDQICGCAGKQNNRDGAGAEEEPDCCMDFSRPEAATGVALGALEIENRPSKR